MRGSLPHLVSLCLRQGMLLSGSFFNCLAGQCLSLLRGMRVVGGSVETLQLINTFHPKSCRGALRPRPAGPGNAALRGRAAGWPRDRPVAPIWASPLCPLVATKVGSSPGMLPVLHAAYISRGAPP